MTLQPQNHHLTATHVSKVTIFWNCILSSFKLTAGIMAHSGAMISDGIHSASDVFSTIIVIIGVKAAGKAADQEHPYGHERLEYVAALLLSIVLFATGAGIGCTGIRKIFYSSRSPLPVPGQLALMAAAVSIAVKEIMYHYTKAAAKRVNSGALMADAWHHRSDALSSIGSLIGIAGARMGFPVLDPAAGIVICIFILKAALDIFIDSINKMIDRSCDNEKLNAIAENVLAQSGVLGIDRLCTRLFGDRIYVDVEIRADGKASLSQSHEIAQKVHDMVESSFPEVKHCMVHMNPADEPDIT